jgi:TusA-related sulfurtransferase
MTSFTLKSKRTEIGGGILIIFNTADNHPNVEEWVRLDANHQVVEVSTEKYRNELINAAMAVLGAS